MCNIWRISFSVYGEVEIMRRRSSKSIGIPAGVNDERMSNV